LYSLTIGADITKFNGFVKLFIDLLAAHGKTMTDLLTNLFKSYLAVNNKTFLAYIGRKQENYEEGNGIATEDLMTMADNKSKLLKEGNRRNTPSEDEEKILALHAEIKTLQKQASKAKKRTPMAPKKRNGNGNPKNKGHDKLKNNKPNWMTNSKKPNDLKKPKSWNKNNWHWCSLETSRKCASNYHCHKPESCEGRAHKFSPKTSANKGGNKRLKLAQAILAIQGNLDDDEG
jgi:hypothetical protein